ncbi:MAG: type I restriction-modification system subunit M [Actinomycetota bacterium]|nr:type I restriction-modification system subunit M [Actinomycetota bacterium]
MTTDLKQLQTRLWGAADSLRANSGLRSSEYSTPVLGLIFLRYADLRFAAAHEELEGEGSGRRRIGPADYHAQGVLYLHEPARFDHLLNLPEGADLGKAVNDAMRAIENANPDLKGVLPRAYSSLPNDALAELLRLLSQLPKSIEGDGFGLIYEYFLGQFASSEGQKGGEFFTPTSIVKLIVEIIEPYHGKIYDPACGSGGMFVQSAHFVERHRKDPGSELSIYGQEKTKETVRLAKMNLAVHGLAGDIREANTYYEDLHDSVGRFDFVMANPPFNVNKVDKAKIEDDPRFPFGLPKPDNANYLWIQTFYSALNQHGRAGFVMANSASDARGSEMEIRRQLIEDRCVDVIVSVGTNFFFTVTLPVTLWFLDRGKRGTEREDQVLFIDARDIYHQIDRAHRDWTPEQIEFLANIVRLWRGEEPEFTQGSDQRLLEHFPEKTYLDIAGLCASVDIAAIRATDSSLNPGRHVGYAVASLKEAEFQEQITPLGEEFESLAEEAEILTAQVLSTVEAIRRRSLG